MRAVIRLARLPTVALVWVLLTSGPLPANGQAPENQVDVARPAPGRTVEIQAVAGRAYNLVFDPVQAELKVEGDSLVLAFDDDGDGVPDSRIVFRDMINAAMADDPPVFVVAGTAVSADVLVSQALAPEMPRFETIEPAKGDGPDVEALGDLAELRHTGRDLLFPGEKERSGHPLYSYLLFAGASEGAREERTRFTSAIKAYIGQVRAADALVSRGVERARINIFYAPMRPIFADTTPTSMRLHFAQRSRPEQIKLLTDLYDHAGAEILMAQMRLNGNGPFIVSALRPLSLAPVAEDEVFLVQDLSDVPPDLVALWIDEFKRQVVQEATESPEHLRRLALNLRTQIAVLAEAFAITKSAVAEMFEAPDGVSGNQN